jgi:hypothetical protein
MNAGASAGRIPANVSDAERASVTAGLANDVEAVNQYAAVMYEATAMGTADERSRAQPQITASSPNVATNSLNAWASPERACLDAKNTGGLEHQMGRGDTGERANDLSTDVQRNLVPRQPALRRVGERDGRIEMRARDGTERENQSDQRRTRGDGIGKEGDGDVAARQPFAHDPGADDRCQQETRADGLGGHAPSDRSLHFHCVSRQMVLRCRSQAAHYTGRPA